MPGPESITKQLEDVNNRLPYAQTPEELNKLEQERYALENEGAEILARNVAKVALDTDGTIKDEVVAPVLDYRGRQVVPDEVEDIKATIETGGEN